MPTPIISRAVPLPPTTAIGDAGARNFCNAVRDRLAALQDELRKISAATAAASSGGVSSEILSQIERTITDLERQIAEQAALVADLIANQGQDFDAQTANTVFAGPASGGSALPAFRALVQADLPDLGPVIHAAPVKAAPVAADEFGLSDSEDANLLKRITLADLAAAINTYLLFGYLIDDLGDYIVDESGGRISLS